MKIAISCDSDRSSIDQRFGRCRLFAITSDFKEFEFLENQGAIQGHGAAIRAVEQLGEQGVEAVITGNLGPNATQALASLGIKAYQASGKIKEAAIALSKGELKEINEIVPSHNGMPPEVVLFPLQDDNGMASRISPDIYLAPFFGIYDMDKAELKIIENKISNSEAQKSPISQIKEFASPTTIFASSIGGSAIKLIAEAGISLKTGDFSTVKEALDNWGRLENQT